MGLFGSRSDRSSDREEGAPASKPEPQRKQPSSWSTAPMKSSVTDREDASKPAAHERRAQGGETMANIGQSIVFKGELTGDEDLEIDGQVEGDVHLASHQLTIGPNGRLKAEVQAQSILVIGRIVGNLTASDRIEIQATGVVEGDIKAPRLLIQEGAVLNGRIEMSEGSGASTSASPAKTSASPAAARPAPASGSASSSAASSSSAKSSTPPSS